VAANTSVGALCEVCDEDRGLNTGPGWGGDPPMTLRFAEARAHRYGRRSPLQTWNISGGLTSAPCRAATSISQAAVRPLTNLLDGSIRTHSYRRVRAFAAFP
jgi:hypothetical protein